MIHLIDKDALVTEIEKRIGNCAKQREDMLNVQCHTLADDASARMGELNCIKDFLDTLEVKEELVSEDLGGAAEKYAHEAYSHPVDRNIGKADFIVGAQWQKKHLWKSADGDELPEIDREVIALLGNGKVVFAHRPPEFWDGKNIVTGKVTRNYPKTYDKGGWNIPNVKYWLDCSMPKVKED